MFLLFIGLDTSKEHEYVLLEEVVSPSSNINNNSPLMPTPNQRMVGMQEMPLQVRQTFRDWSKKIKKAL